MILLDTSVWVAQLRGRPIVDVTAPLADADWLRCGAIAARLRAAGTPVPPTDVTVAVASLGRATLWTADRDVERIAAVEPDLDLRLLARP